MNDPTHSQARTRTAPPVWHNMLGHAVLNDPQFPVTLEQQRKAQIMVARNALDTQDCAELLDMLGIGGVE